jgi:hypothetical protein
MIRKLPSQAALGTCVAPTLPSRVPQTTQRKPCQFRKIRFLKDLDILTGLTEGGNKGLLTMFARQFFPT